MKKKILAADFGTSYGKMAYMDADGSILFPTFPARFSGGIPMLFMYDRKGNEWIGEQVDDRNGRLEDPAAVCESIKMNLLKKDSIFLNEKAFTPNYIVFAEAKHQLEVARQCYARSFVDLDYDMLVVPVPVCYTAAEKAIMKTEHQKAYHTSHLNTHLVDEAVADALAYIFLRGKNIDPNLAFFVIDIGDGSTDAALLLPCSGEEPFSINHPMGIRTAGSSFSKALVETVLSQLRRTPGSLNMDIMENRDHFAYRRLLAQCRTAKEHLSDSDSYSLEVSDSCGGFSRITITREDYENAIRPLVKEIVDMAETIINACNLGIHPKMNIVLAGGSAHTPLVQKMMQERFYWVDKECFVPRLTPNSLAMGAVLYGAREKKITPKSSYGYAVEVSTENNTKDRLLVLIPPNTSLPCKVSTKLCTVADGQSSCEMHIYEVSRGFTDQLLDMHEGIATDYVLTHKFPYKVPKETVVILTVELTENGTLNLTVRDKVAGGKSSETCFSLDGMDTNEIRKQINKAIRGEW